MLVTQGLGMTKDEGFCTGKDIPKPEIRKVTSIHTNWLELQGVKKHDPPICEERETRYHLTYYAFQWYGAGQHSFKFFASIHSAKLQP